MDADTFIHQITFDASLEKLSLILKWIHESVEQAKLGAIESRKVELALEEAIVNIIHYAYKDASGSLEIISRIIPKKRIEFILKDRGISFDPLQKNPNLDLIAPLEERKIGGLGILLIRQYMDEVHYERHHLYNILTLAKEISTI